MLQEVSECINLGVTRVAEEEEREEDGGQRNMRIMCGASPKENEGRLLGCQKTKEDEGNTTNLRSSTKSQRR